MRFLSISIACSFFFSVINAQQPVDDSKTAVLFDKYIQQSLPAWKTPGISVAIVKDGNIIFKKAYGVRDIGKSDPYTTYTLSTCASTTKAMTAVCMGMLIDEGKVKWSDKVQDVLPEFKLSDPYSAAEITVLDLFTHNTGLGNGDLLWVFGYPRNEIIKRMQWMQPAYSLRSSFIYQNLMYIVAGEVIHQLSGKTWEEFITDRIFKAVGMSNTFADHALIASNADATTSHYPDKDTVKSIPYLYNNNIGAAGGVWSCAEDMAKWLQCLLDSTKINGKRLLQPVTYAAIFKPQVIAPQAMYPTMDIIKPNWFTYGLGWFQHDYRGKMVQMHTGSLAGLTAIAGLMPDSHFGIYVFGNLDHAELRHALMFKAFDLWCFKDNGIDWSQKFYQLYKSIADSAKKKEDEQLSKRILNTHPTLPLTAYSGKFTNKQFNAVEIVVTGNSLLAKLPNNINILLQHWQYDTFHGKFSRWWMGNSVARFSIDEDGKVSGVTIDGLKYSRE